jgi:hypothetical protein
MNQFLYDSFYGNKERKRKRNSSIKFLKASLFNVKWWFGNMVCMRTYHFSFVIKTSCSHRPEGKKGLRGVLTFNYWFIYKNMKCMVQTSTISLFLSSLFIFFAIWKQEDIFKNVISCKRVRFIFPSNGTRWFKCSLWLCTKRVELKKHTRILVEINGSNER